MNYHLFIDGVLDCTALLFLDCVALLLLDCVANLRTKTVRKIGMIEKGGGTYLLVHSVAHLLVHSVAHLKG